MDPYKIEVYKSCWIDQLKAIRAANLGELPEDKVAELYGTFRCKFGCPPPEIPAAVFVDQCEVPRPKMTGASKYDSFEDTYGKDTPLHLPPLKAGAVAEIAPPGVLDKVKVQGTIACTFCKRLRCVYVKTKLDAATAGAAPGCNLSHMLAAAIEVNETSYSCGADLDLDGFPALVGIYRPYVRLKLDCSSHVEIQLYSSKILPPWVTDKICGFCGEEGQYAECEGEATPLLPVCQPCLEQHGKSRASGRARSRFDRSGQRSRNAAASQRRQSQVEATRARAQAQQQVPAQAGPSHTCEPDPDDFDVSTGADQEHLEQQEHPNAARKRQRRAAVVAYSDSSDGDEEGDAVGSEVGDDDEVEGESGDSEHDVEDYVVKAIHSVRARRSTLEFLVEWEDYPSEEHFTWEPTRNLPGHKDKLQQFKEHWVNELNKSWPRLRRR